MKIYYSNIASIDSNKVDLQFPKVGVLISYYGLKELKTPSFTNSLFLDSGAFSAWNKNISIDVKEYIDFIFKNKHKIDIYASLDDIESYRNSLNNYNIMEKAGLSPLPCFHIGEPLWILNKYLLKTNYIALGGIAKRNTNDRVSWLDKIFSEYKNVQFHGFGIQNRKILSRYPWHTVDASSAHVMARFGGICTPWGDYKINMKVHYKDLRWVSDKAIANIKSWLKTIYPRDEHLFDKASLGDVDGTTTRVFINILFYENLARQQNDFSFDTKMKGFGM